MNDNLAVQSISAHACKLLFICRKIWHGGPLALLLLRRKECCAAGFEPVNLGSNGKHTITPPRQLRKVLYVLYNGQLDCLRPYLSTGAFSFNKKAQLSWNFICKAYLCNSWISSVSSLSLHIMQIHTFRWCLAISFAVAPSLSYMSRYTTYISDLLWMYIF
jgi:hypothetical protein